MCIIIIYIYGRVRELKSLFYHFRFFPLVFFSFFSFLLCIYILYIYIHSYIIYLIDYFLPYRALLFRCAFLGLLMWSSNFRHGLLKSLLSKYTLFSILYTLYIYTIPSFPSTLLFQTQAYERISQRMRVPPPFYSRNIDITSQDIIDANVTRSFTYSR